MAHTNIVPASKRTVGLGAVGAGSTTQQTGVIDMQGFESVVGILLLGTLTAGQTKGVFKAQAGNAADGSDMADLVGASITVNDTAGTKAEVLEVFRMPGFRYARFQFVRNSQAAAINGIIVEQYHARKMPESDDATTVDQTLVAVEPQYTNTALMTTTFAPATTTTKFVHTNRNSS